MDSVIKRGNIVRKNWPGRASLEDEKYVNLYLGSGRFGACFDAYGLMNREYTNWCEWDNKKANTVLQHSDHWSRGNYGLDYQLPVARLAWNGSPPDEVKDYSQELDIYDGRLKTQMKVSGSKLETICWFNPYSRDTFAMEVNYALEGKGEIPCFALIPELQVKTQYGSIFQGSFEYIDATPDGMLLLEIKIGTAHTVLCMKIISEEGMAWIEKGGSGPVFRFDGRIGKHLLLIGAAGVSRKHELVKSLNSIKSIKAYEDESREAWHRRWGDSWIDIPDYRYQALWCRSLYYILCSYSPDVICTAPPHGWTGNGWNFHFPQDFSYIHPALLRLGHLDIARSKVEFYRSRLEDSMRNTKRIFGAEGAFWAWEFPIGPGFDLFRESCSESIPEEILKLDDEGNVHYAAPNWFQFEIHNSAYPARMAYETSLHVKDEKWTREIAWPIVRESTRFFVSIMHKETEGTWGIQVKPSMGQDEAGGYNARNYICALYSAKYCLKTALKLAESLKLDSEELERWCSILRDGLAFERLYSKDKGIYYTCEDIVGEAPDMKQKHPIQLNPLIFLPLDKIDEPVRRAYEKRRELCPMTKENFSPGWTLGAFWLAASHMNDSAALLQELEQILPMNYMDKDMLQIYESSGLYWSQYYTTTHGLLLQALNDALVSDFWGEVTVGAACPEEWKAVRFKNLHTKDGRVISGEKIEDNWNVTEELI